MNFTWPKSNCWQDYTSPRGCKGESSISWLLQLLVAARIPWHHFNLCLCGHITSSFSLSSVSLNLFIPLIRICMITFRANQIIQDNFLILKSIIRSYLILFVGFFVVWLFGYKGNIHRFQRLEYGYLGGRAIINLPHHPCKAGKDDYFHFIDNENTGIKKLNTL